jgi:hypothetical protein
MTVSKSPKEQYLPTLLGLWNEVLVTARCRPRGSVQNRFYSFCFLGISLVKSNPESGMKVVQKSNTLQIFSPCFHHQDLLSKVWGIGSTPRPTAPETIILGWKDPASKSVRPTAHEEHTNPSWCVTTGPNWVHLRLVTRGTSGTRLHEDSWSDKSEAY